VPTWWGEGEGNMTR